MVCLRFYSSKGELIDNVPINKNCSNLVHASLLLLKNSRLTYIKLEQACLLEK